MASDDPQKFAELIVNQEARLIQLEHDVSILQKRMPKSKMRRVFWWLSSTLWLLIPIVGGIVSFFGEEPWKGIIVIGAFGVVVGKTVSDFARMASQGPRPHRSLLVEDYR